MHVYVSPRVPIMAVFVFHETQVKPRSSPFWTLRQLPRGSDPLPLLVFDALIVIVGTSPLLHVENVVYFVLDICIRVLPSRYNHLSTKRVVRGGGGG